MTSVVNTCKSLGFPESAIVVDVVLVDNSTLAFKNTSEYTSFDMIGRALEIVRYYGTFDGLLRA